MNNAATFQVGNTYAARSACDHSFNYLFTVTARTAKFLTLTNARGESKRVGVRTWNGQEMALPLGSYSMAPVLRSDRLAS